MQLEMMLSIQVIYKVDVVGIRMDLDNNELLISVNGSDKGKMYDIQGLHTHLLLTFTLVLQLL